MSSSLQFLKTKRAPPPLSLHPPPPNPSQSNCSIPNPYNLNPSLPIFSKHHQILSTINSNQITIICGSTGCGKTTQIPQLIYNSFYLFQRPLPSILITQPRRLAATTISRRLCHEMHLTLGKEIGYQVGMNHFCSSATRIFLKTTGIFLEELINSKDRVLSTYTHIILDEIHERDINIDLVLTFIKDILPQAPHIKLILMSATISSSVFARYFQTISPDNKKPPIIEIDVPRYKITYNYLDETISKINTIKYKNNESKMHINRCNFDIGNAYLEEALFPIAKDIIEICDNDERINKRNSCILIFLPGIGEILSFKEYLERELEMVEGYDICILHSNIPQDEQDNVMKNNNNKRKVILATNIAESSLTIKNTDYVIDFCLLKEVHYNQMAHNESLELVWASKANCMQRSGRTGRLRDGTVFRLVPYNFYMTLHEYPSPEIQRMSLEKVILKVKIYYSYDPKDILLKAIQPPDLETVDETINYLKRFGALTIGDKQNPTGELTEWGKVYAKLPIDIRYGRLIMLCYAFNMIEAGIVIAAILSQEKKIFKAFRKGRNIMYLQRYVYANGSECDMITAYNAFKEWEKKHGYKLLEDEFDTRMKFFHSKSEESKSEREWCESKLLDAKILKETLRVVSDIKKRLHKDNLYNSSINTNNKKILTYIDFSKESNIEIFKFILAGAFYTNIFYPSYKKESLFRPSMNSNNSTIPEATKVEVINLPSRYHRKALKKLKCLYRDPNTICSYESIDETLRLTFSSIEATKQFVYTMSNSIYHNEFISQLAESLHYNGPRIKINFLYEPNFSTIMNSQHIDIDNDSINSIFIEPDFERKAITRYVTDEIYERHNKNCSHFVSKLPTIPLFDILAILVFAPSVSFFKNDAATHYGSFSLSNNSSGKKIYFTYLFSSIDLHIVNEIRAILNKLFKLKIGVYREIETLHDNDKELANKVSLYEDIIEVYSTLSKSLITKVNELIHKKRFKVIFRNEWVDLFNRCYPQQKDIINTNEHSIQRFPRLGLNNEIINEHILQSKYYNEKEVDMLPKLNPLPIENDFYLWTEDGMNELQSERDRYNKLKELVKISLDNNERIIYADAGDVYCGRCDSYVCSMNTFTQEQSYENIACTLFVIGGWVTMNVRLCDVEDELVQKEKFVEMNRQWHFKPDKYVCCASGNHIIGFYIEKMGKYYATTYSDLKIKFPMQTFKRFTQELWKDGFKKYKELLERDLEEKRKRMVQGIKCILCNEVFYEVKGFMEHKKSTLHKSKYEELCSEIF